MHIEKGRPKPPSGGDMGQRRQPRADVVLLDVRECAVGERPEARLIANLFG